MQSQCSVRAARKFQSCVKSPEDQREMEEITPDRFYIGENLPDARGYDDNHNNYDTDSRLSTCAKL